MAKKKINIVLIIVVLALWGTVGYRALNRQFTNREMSLEKQNQLGNTTINQINKDTFKLENINRDPFSNKEFRTESVTVPVKKYFMTYPTIKKTYVSIVKPQIDLSWPTLKYYGYFKSKDQELILLKVDSKLCKLKLNDPLNGLIVTKKYKDSIIVFFNSESRIIRLKQQE